MTIIERIMLLVAMMLTYPVFILIGYVLRLSQYEKKKDLAKMGLITIDGEDIYVAVNNEELYKAKNGDFIILKIKKIRKKDNS